MNQKHILIVLFIVAAVLAPVASQGQISISVGDRGYYTRGAYYVDGGYRYSWVPGHWGPKHRWVHGHYARGGIKIVSPLHPRFWH
ncbi:MAG: hypothetical protein ABI883_01140 [Chthoniobacterales bacterium]